MGRACNTWNHAFGFDPQEVKSSIHLKRCPYTWCSRTEWHVFTPGDLSCVLMVHLGLFVPADLSCRSFNEIGTAGYAILCPVVWEGGDREATPYPYLLYYS